MNGEIFRNILTDSFDEIKYKESKNSETEKKVNVIDVLERLSDWRYDSDIADELDVKVVTVRKLLNELHEADLVTYRRSKDKETGWYTYVWKRREEMVSGYVNEYLNLHLLNLRNTLEYEESNTWLDCSCSRVTLDEAMENDFTCPTCGETYVESKVSDKIKNIESDIRELRETIKKL